MVLEVDMAKGAWWMRVGGKTELQERSEVPNWCLKNRYGPHNKMDGAWFSSIHATR